ncbi:MULTISPECIES: hypothetical protein [Pseudoalteromonas]|uniref:hypothetical protein n=1 Tax=Pseudoalteromonas TaxID=53246 RepID=UPI001F3FF5CF|nr:MULTISPECIES: hypothetical protein [unclassified Pseudoalteromonas]MCF2827306.1 hypothetical protein [Pseudoalteromonas sp. OF5H-5]MCF2834585.1 hypothetical protein [Pseudoalteromonas sp. DL2-H6]MCF2926464.1 hypothetical protein [Pseudoalteromonas sp. DL2-H1]
MKTFKCNKVARGVLLIAVSLSLYLYLVLNWMYLALAFVVFGILSYLFLVQCKALLDDKKLDIKWLGQIHSSYDISDCNLYVHQGAVFEVIVCQKRWLWIFHLLDEKSALVEAIFSNQSEVVSSAKENNKKFFSLLALRTGFLISCSMMILPAIQYFQLPSDIDLHAVKGKLVETNVNKSLLISIEGYSTLFVMSPKAGNLAEFDSRLKPNKGQELSMFVTQKLASSEVEKTDVWEIRLKDQKLISYSEIRASWINWKRFFVFVLLGVCGIAYCLQRIKLTNSYIKLEP